MHGLLESSTKVFGCQVKWSGNGDLRGTFPDRLPCVTEGKEKIISDDFDELNVLSFGGDKWKGCFFCESASGDGGGAINEVSGEDSLLIIDVSTLPRSSSKIMRRRPTAAATTAAL